MKKSPRDHSLGAQMAIALQLMRKKHQQALSKIGVKVTLEQLAVLEVLSIRGDMNMSKLSVATWKQNANITRMVDKLEKLDLVKRMAVKDDRRANLVRITQEGKQIFEEVIALMVDVNKENLSCISEEEEASALGVIKKIIGHLSQN